jgi:hypothetical protein
MMHSTETGSSAQTNPVRAGSNSTHRSSKSKGKRVAAKSGRRHSGASKSIRKRHQKKHGKKSRTSTFKSQTLQRHINGQLTTVSTNLSVVVASSSKGEEGVCAFAHKYQFFFFNALAVGYDPIRGYIGYGVPFGKTRYPVRTLKEVYDMSRNGFSHALEPASAKLLAAKFGKSPAPPPRPVSPLHEFWNTVMSSGDGAGPSNPISLFSDSSDSDGEPASGRPVAPVAPTPIVNVDDNKPADRKLWGSATIEGLDVDFKIRGVCTNDLDRLLTKEEPGRKYVYAMFMNEFMDPEEVFFVGLGEREFSAMKSVQDDGFIWYKCTFVGTRTMTRKTTPVLPLAHHIRVNGLKGFNESSKSAIRMIVQSSNARHLVWFEDELRDIATLQRAAAGVDASVAPEAPVSTAGPAAPRPSAVAGMDVEVSADDGDEDDVVRKCSICLDHSVESNSNPKLFSSCGHVLCSLCFGKYVRKNISQVGNFTCPTCRKFADVESVVTIRASVKKCVGCNAAHDAESCDGIRVLTCGHVACRPCSQTNSITVAPVFPGQFGADQKLLTTCPQCSHTWYGKFIDLCRVNQRLVETILDPRMTAEDDPTRKGKEAC